jgi:tetratricopeptide (TPR) repeat protein
MAQEQLKAKEPSASSKHTSTNGATGGSIDALADDPEVGRRKPTSFARFVRDVVIIGALLGGGMYLYRKNVVTKAEVATLSMEAADKLEKDDLQSLKEAEEVYKKILDLDSDNDRGVVGLGETYFYMSRHGLPTRPQAEQYAAQISGDRPEIAALNAYLKITNGQAAQAESDVKALLDKDVASSKLAHALGWSYLEQGNYTQANQVVRAALDTDFNAVRFALTLAEVAHRNGEERAASRHLRMATGQAMNPNHELALTWLAALAAKNYGNITEPAKHIQDVEARKDKIGPKSIAFLGWAKGELALAMGNAQGALESAEEAIKADKSFAPFYDLKARAQIALKKDKDAIETYQEAVKLRPEYRGIKLDLAKLLTAKKDDAALALIDELQKSSGHAQPGPEFEILRGEHHLAKGDTEAAKASFTKAADLGDDPAILFGLAKVAFLEEKKKDKKADLERVAEAFQQALERRSSYPEVHQYMADISLWNFDMGGASASYVEAETGYKKANKPVPFMVRFYDSAIESFTDVKEKSARAEADKQAAEWKKKKEEYLSSVVTAGGSGGGE